MSVKSPNISGATPAQPLQAPPARAVLRLVPSAGRAFIVTEGGERWASGTIADLGEAGPGPTVAVLREPGAATRVFVWASPPEGGAPGYWGREAWERFDAALADLAGPLGAAGARLLLRPHHARTLADVPGALRLLNGPHAERLGLLLDPAAMLAPSMLPGAKDHLRRIFEALGPRADALVLSNIAALPGADGDETLAPAPLRAGLLDADLLLSLAADHVPSSALRVFLSGDREGPRIEGVAPAGGPR